MAIIAYEQIAGVAKLAAAATTATCGYFEIGFGPGHNELLFLIVVRKFRAYPLYCTLI